MQSVAAGVAVVDEFVVPELREPGEKDVDCEQTPLLVRLGRINILVGFLSEVAPLHRSRQRCLESRDSEDFSMVHSVHSPYARVVTGEDRIYVLGLV